MSKRRDAKDTIEQLLKSKELRERLNAVELLKEKKDIERLISLLYSESWHLREKTAEALASFGQEIGERIMLLLSEGYWYVRASAAYIIGEINEDRAFEKLRELLRETNETVKGEAAKAIAKILIRRKDLQKELEPEEKILLLDLLRENKCFNLIENLKKDEILS